MPMAQAIIFDLDNCLAPADAAGPELMAPMFAAIRQANRGLLSEATLERAFKECWRSSLDVVAAMHGFSEDMLAAAWHVGRRLEVRGPLEGYSDVPLLATLPAMLFLVTTGFRRLQASKIAAVAAPTGKDGWLGATHPASALANVTSSLPGTLLWR